MEIRTEGWPLGEDKEGIQGYRIGIATRTKSAWERGGRGGDCIENDAEPGAYAGSWGPILRAVIEEAETEVEYRQPRVRNDEISEPHPRTSGPSGWYGIGIGWECKHSQEHVVQGLPK